MSSFEKLEKIRRNYGFALRVRKDLAEKIEIVAQHHGVKASLIANNLLDRAIRSEEFKKLLQDAPKPADNEKNFLLRKNYTSDIP